MVAKQQRECENQLKRRYVQRYTHGNIFQILLNHTEIRLYIAFSDRFGTKQMSVWFQINQKIINTIWFRFYFVRFWKDFSVCTFRDVEMHREDRIELLTIRRQCWIHHTRFHSWRWWVSAIKQNTHTKLIELGFDSRWYFHLQTCAFWL